MTTLADREENALKGQPLPYRLRRRQALSQRGRRGYRPVGGRWPGQLLG